MYKRIRIVTSILKLWLHQNCRLAVPFFFFLSNTNWCYLSWQDFFYSFFLYVKLKFCCFKSLWLMNAANMDKPLKLKDNNNFWFLLNPLIDEFKFWMTFNKFYPFSFLSCTAVNIIWKYIYLNIMSLRWFSYL